MAGGEEFARADAVAGLAREIEGIRRVLDPLVGLDTDLTSLAGTVSALADVVAAQPARPGPTAAPSWLAAPGEPEATRGLLEGLCSWLRAVFLRYPDGAAALPECWLWHPWMVEELLWLMHAWIAAYQGEGAAVQLAGDWHDRQRPGVVRRLAAVSCTPVRHQQRPGRGGAPDTAPPVPGVDALGAIAAWWALGRDHPAPAPQSPVPQSPGPQSPGPDDRGSTASGAGEVGGRPGAGPRAGGGPGAGPGTHRGTW